MAKLKIGSGIKMEAKVVQPDYPVLPYDENATVPVIEKRVPSIEEVMELIQSTQVQHNHAPVEVDLSGLATKEELNIAVIELCKQRDVLEIKVEEINDKLVEKLSAPREIIVPEVINTTHVKDVSEEVYTKLLDAKVELKGDLKNHDNQIIELQANLKKQQVINYILSGLAALTLLLHLL